MSARGIEPASRLSSRIGLRHLLFVVFTVVSAIPVFLLGVWEHRTAMEREVAAAEEKQLLVARNLTSALERYVTGVDAVFRLAASDLGRGAGSAELRELLGAFHFVHLCLVDADGRIVDAIDLPESGELPARMPAAVLDAFDGVPLEGAVAFADVMAGPGGRPTIHLATGAGDGMKVIGAVTTDYVVEAQQAITFGKLGHAAIVDASGNVLAHPDPEWAAAMKPIAKVPPVQRMMAGETGVSYFYSPAVKLDMVAGFTTVPRTGWGAMIPQPMNELEERAREVGAVALQITVAGVLVAALASWWLAGLLAGPVLAVARAARHDALTGLPNRVLFRERLDSLMTDVGQGMPFTLLYLDLDDFKDVNDTLGHTVGDLLLGEVATRLGACVGDDDTVARLGGDEFGILHAGTPGGETVEALAQRILDTVSAPYVVEGVEVHVGGGIGITSYPTDSRDPDQLLRNADLAMYAAKAQARNSFMSYRAEMNARVRARKSMEDDLRGAMERGELALHLQPIVSAAEGRVISVEALARWRHPERGTVSPAEFIPLAERSGLIVPIGEWVLGEACAKLREIHDAGLAGIDVAVNLSPAQLRRPDLVPMVTGILERTGVAPAHLDLEITENDAMRDIDAETEVLGRLSAMGIKLSIDDFGTGHSSLSQLKRLPVDRIKIDGGFVRGIGRKDDEAIVTSILRLGRGLGLPVVAEQVETQAQMDFLRRQGCAELQGYLFSAPIPGEEIVEGLRRYQADPPVVPSAPGGVVAELPGAASAERRAFAAAALRPRSA